MGKSSGPSSHLPPLPPFFIAVKILTGSHNGTICRSITIDSTM